VISHDVIALDASVGVKWFRPEAGSEVAQGFLTQALEGQVTLVAPVHFAHEVLSVVTRRVGPWAAIDVWDDLADAGVALVPLDADLVREAASQCAALGCTFYDALAPAVAARFDATLVSADAKAHGGFPGVRIVG
jgi:predicted nucleic acid-binding protein